jgi:serine/threonine protein kinase
MPIGSVADLVDTVRNGRLLEPAQLRELSALEASFPDPQALARELVRRGWLTPYQVNALFQGRGRELLLGSYVLLEKLGEGGMGQVFKARNWKLGQAVALKLIRKERLTNADAVRRFHREIRAVAQLSHPNVVRAYDADEIGGTHLLVMEYAEGTDLARLVKQRGPLPVAEACEYVRQAALGLQHVYERGLVHRDIKPSNLLLSRQGTVKILDLGLALLTGGEEDRGASAALTGEGMLMGTADYMAPEQAQESHAVDVRADLYSLGCTLYFLLAGRAPFPTGTVLQKLTRHQSEEPTPLEQLRPDVPPGLAAVVRKALAKRPGDRFQTPRRVGRRPGRTPGGRRGRVRP